MCDSHHQSKDTYKYGRISNPVFFKFFKSKCEKGFNYGFTEYRIETCLFCFIATPFAMILRCFLDQRVTYDQHRTRIMTRGHHAKTASLPNIATWYLRLI